MHLTLYRWDDRCCAHDASGSCLAMAAHLGQLSLYLVQQPRTVAARLIALHAVVDAVHEGRLHEQPCPVGR